MVECKKSALKRHNRFALHHHRGTLDIEVGDKTRFSLDYIAQEQCRVLAFDLTGVKLIPSGLLGLLASVRQIGAEVHLYNPSDDVREVLAVTHLDRLMPVHDIDMN